MNTNSASHKRNIGIITDTTSTIKPDEFPNVSVVSLLITMENSKSLRDQREITLNEIYEYLKNNPKTANVKTSSPMTSDMIEFAKAASKKYDDVIILPVSSGLSVTYNQWKMLLESELKEYSNLHLFDTKDIAISLKWLITDILDLIDKGTSVSEIREYIKNWHSRIGCTVILNDLNQAKRGGRIGKIKALVAGLLKIKPILHFYKGSNSIVDRAFTNKMAIEKSFDIFKKILGITKNKIIRVGFCNSFNSKNKVLEVLKDLTNIVKTYGPLKIEESPITPIISSHTGNDAFSINILIDKKS